MFCPECGFSNPDYARFCGRCGKDLSAYQRYVSYVPSDGGVSGTNVSVGGTGLNGGIRGTVTRNPLLLLGIAAVLVVVLLVFGITRCVGGGGGQGSVEALAAAVQEPYQMMLDEGMADDAVRDSMRSMLDLMNGEVLDAVVEEGGYDGQSGILDEMVDQLSRFSSVLEVYEKSDSVVEIHKGKHFDEDDLDELNDTFRYDLDLPLRVEDAANLSMRIEITLREDVGNFSAGESTSQEMDRSGIYAIKIDGQWYFWTDGLI